MINPGKKLEHIFINSVTTLDDNEINALNL